MKSVFLGAVAAALLVSTAACTKKKEQRESVPATDSMIITQATPPAGGSWADVANATPAGGIMRGNPKAAVKLVEYGSLTCPHCKAFEDEGAPLLNDKYVKTGKVSWEFRPYIIHGPIDLAANLIVRCNGLKSFFPLVEAAYRDQPSWLARIEAAPQDQLAQLQTLPAPQMLPAMASLLGLQDWAALHGVPHAKTEQCLRDQKMIDQEVRVTTDVSNQYPEFTGTPAFIVNGKMLPKDVTTFAKLEPALLGALK